MIFLFDWVTVYIGSMSLLRDVHAVTMDLDGLTQSAVLDHEYK